MAPGCAASGHLPLRGACWELPRPHIHPMKGVREGGPAGPAG